jgi:hypothetical protein
MNNRYNYKNNRKTSYNNRNNGAGSIAGLIVALIGITIVLGIWVLSLKTDIRHLSDDKFLLILEKTEIKHKMDSIVNTLQPPKKEVVVEKTPKITLRKHKKDTTAVKTKVVKIETIQTVVDTTGL